MPAGYTHFQFIEDIIKQLPDSQMKDMIIKNKAIFQIGTHGPDIFFYHKVYNFHDKVNCLGKRMHRENARPFFEKAMSIIDDEAKLCYILGFLCHFILDSQMHPCVYKIMKETRIQHFEIESEYDRLLLKRNKLDPTHSLIYSHIIINEHHVSTIQAFFPELSYLDVQEALLSLKEMDKLLTAPSYLKRGMLYFLFHLTFHFHKLQGLIINYHHNIKMEKYYQLLDETYQNSLKEALQYLDTYCLHLNNKTALPNRFDQYYKGD